MRRERQLCLVLNKSCANVQIGSARNPAGGEGRQIKILFLKFGNFFAYPLTLKIISQAKLALKLKVLIFSVSRKIEFLENVGAFEVRTYPGYLCLFEQLNLKYLVDFQ